MPKKRKRSARIAVHAERGDRVVIIMVMITMMIMTIMIIVIMRMPIMLGIMMVKGKGENGDVDENDDG